MNAETPTPTDETPEVRRALETIKGAQAALREGRRVRGRKPLREAVRVLQDAERLSDAVLAFRTLALLELRRDDVEKALSCARAALRLARRGGTEADLDGSLDLLARVSCLAGEHGKARGYAEERLRHVQEAAHPSRIAAARRRLALTCWAAGQAVEALSHAEAAVEASGPGEVHSARLFAALLLAAGCPIAAHKRLAALPPEDGQAQDGCRLLLARGWARMAVGDADAAAREFRRALRAARSFSDGRLSVEAAAALAAAEARSTRTATAARRARAEARLERAAKQGRRLKDIRLERFIEGIRQYLERAGEDTPPHAEKRPIVEAADRLRDLGLAAESLAVVDACVLEVERLAATPRTEPPYHCASLLPLALNLLGE